MINPLHLRTNLLCNRWKGRFTRVVDKQALTEQVARLSGREQVSRALSTTIKEGQGFKEESKEEAAGKKYQVNYPDSPTNLIRIDLGDAIP